MVVHAGDAIFHVARIPGLNGSPGERAGQAVFVGEGRSRDMVDSCDAGVSRRCFDGAEDLHLQVERWVFHAIWSP